MANNTTNYGFNLPLVDGSEDLWGDLLNQNWSNLDALLLARDQAFAALEGRTLTAGDGLSGGGDLTLDRTFTLGTPGTLNGGTANSVTVDSHTHAITSTASRTDPSTTTLLQAAGMNTHRTSGDHDSRYAQLAGGAAANFTSMPQVGGAPIVESGSNTDGEWVRWADGTQICYHDNPTAFTTSSASGPIYLGSSPTFSFPAMFIQPPRVESSAHRQNMSDGNGVLWTAPAQDNSATTTSVRLILVGNISTGRGKIGYTAIGRWK